MSPTSAMRRGTRPDAYINQPSSRPFPKPAQKAGPIRNVHSWSATSALPATMAKARLLVSPFVPALFDRLGGLLRPFGHVP